MKKLVKYSHRLLQLVALALVSVMAGCEHTDEVTPLSLKTELQQKKPAAAKVYYGPATQIGDGSARVWVEMLQGKPQAIGIELTADALATIENVGFFEVNLKLPGQAHATGYKTISLGWNPMGHEPEGVYTLPHFDFHFYMQTEGQIMQIDGGPDPEAWELAGTVFPPFYVFGPEPFAVPHMGVHWSDVRSPEFSPAGFSKTFIYGSYRDKVTFLEPMITVAYLRSLAPGDSETLEVPSLLKYENPGYYAGTYTIAHTLEGTYSIALTDLMWRNKNN